MRNLIRSLRWFVVVIVLLLPVLACSSGKAPTTAQAVATQPPAPPATQAQPTTGAVTPQGSAGGAFALMLPDGQKVSLQAQCAGVRPGEFLDVVAINSPDLNDPNRVEVKVGGLHQATGQLANMVVSITMGAQTKWTFMGNTLQAQLTLEADGSGRFADVAITNVAVGSPVYAYAAEYKFSAEWSCKP
jgi:hypothetical protein